MGHTAYRAFHTRILPLRSWHHTSPSQAYPASSSGSVKQKRMIIKHLLNTNLFQLMTKAL